MADYTSVRLRVQTRDDVKRLAAARGVSADQVIMDALATYEWETLRKEAELEARALSQSPEYQAELAAALHELSGGDE